ncbi:MAG: Na+/H+ antiporter NhaC, partial [Aeromonas sobria]
NGIFMAGVLGVATLDYLPYMWLSFTCIIVTVSLAYMGKGVNRIPLVAAASSR